MFSEFPMTEGASFRKEGMSDAEWKIECERVISTQVDEFLTGFRRKLLTGDASAAETLDRLSEDDPFKLREREEAWLNSTERAEGLLRGDVLSIFKETGIRLTRRFIDEVPADPLPHLHL